MRKPPFSSLPLHFLHAALPCLAYSAQKGFSVSPASPKSGSRLRLVQCFMPSISSLLLRKDFAYLHVAETMKMRSYIVFNKVFFPSFKNQHEDLRNSWDSLDLLPRTLRFTIFDHRTFTSCVPAWSDFLIFLHSDPCCGRDNKTTKERFVPKDELRISFHSGE